MIAVLRDRGICEQTGELVVGGCHGPRSRADRRLDLHDARLAGLNSDVARASPRRQLYRPTDRETTVELAFGELVRRHERESAARHKCQQRNK